MSRRPGGLRSLGSGERWIDFRFGYLPAFDGLRGITVAMLVLYHVAVAYRGPGSSWLVPGAFFWIELFFVQSGFLIASLLLEERYRTGEVRLRNFYARRAIRLFPALAVVVLLTGLWLLTFSDRHGVLISEAWTEVWASLFYFMNWISALHVNAWPHYLSHAWSLSIEEQFYFVMPLVMIVLLRRGSLTRAMAVIAGGALASATWMALLASRTTGGDSLGRLYYGTDTRAQGLLIGVLMAIVLHMGYWPTTEKARRLIRIWAWTGAAILVAILLTTHIKLRPAYFGVFTLCSLSAVGILTEVLVHPGAQMSRLLSWRPLQHVGKMAYGIYLWHWPVILVIVQFADWPLLPLIVVQVITTLLVASASYYGLERPLLRRWAPRFPRLTAEREEAHQRRLAAAVATREEPDAAVGTASA